MITKYAVFENSNKETTYNLGVLLGKINDSTKTTKELKEKFESFLNKLLKTNNGLSKKGYLLTPDSTYILKTDTKFYFNGRSLSINIGYGGLVIDRENLKYYSIIIMMTKRVFSNIDPLGEEEWEIND
jgi:hypothetical protein